VVGPLSRSGSALVAQRAIIAKPTIMLASADALGASGTLPANLLAIGLSVEDEARQAALWAARTTPSGSAYVVTAGAAWQQRAARAFAAEWQRRGQRAQIVELGVAGGYLNPNDMLQFTRKIQAERGELVFAALDMLQTRQLREAMSGEVQIYGTSQLNPLALPDWSRVEPLFAMDGVRLIDLPWQLQANHPAVAALPRMQPEPEQRLSADLERLYALGADAWRVAREIARNQTNFEIDGVTGRLYVSFGPGATRFERLEVPAIYQDGVVVPYAGGR